MSQQLILSTPYVLRYMTWLRDESLPLSTMIADSAPSTMRPILQSLDTDANWMQLASDPRIMLVTYSYGRTFDPALDYDIATVALKPITGPRALYVSMIPMNGGTPAAIVEIRVVHSMWRGVWHRFAVPPLPPPM